MCRAAYEPVHPLKNKPKALPSLCYIVSIDINRPVLMVLLS